MSTKLSFALTLALRYLQGRRLRSLLTTLAIAFGVLLIFGMNSVIPVFTRSLQANAMAASGQSDVTITSKTGGAFPADIVQTIQEVDGVAHATGVLERSVGLPVDFIDHDPARQDWIVAVNLVGADPLTLRGIKALIIEEGRFLAPEDTNQAVISRSLAEAAGLGLGDTLSLPSATGVVDLEIAGLMPRQVLPGNEKVYVNLPSAQAMLAMPGQINAIDANFDSTLESRRSETEAQIKERLGPNYGMAVLAAGTEILNNIQMATMMMNLFAWLGMLMGGFIIFNTFRTIVAERRRDIGMLRSIGANRRTITGLIVMEGLVQGLVGSAAGLASGYLLARVMLAVVAPIGKQYLNVAIGEIVINPLLVLAAAAAGVAITLLAGILPARAASRVSPLEALRPTLGSVSFRRLAGVGFWLGVGMIAAAAVLLFSKNTGLLGLGSLLFLAGLLVISPALVYPIASLFGRLMALTLLRDGTAYLAEGNLERQPSRTAVTASTTMIAIAIVVMAASMMSSLVLSFRQMLQQSLSSEYLLVPPSIMAWGLNVGAAPGLADDLRAVPGVKEVGTLRFASARVGELPVSILGIDPAFYTNLEGLTFTEGDPRTAYLKTGSGRYMIINGMLSSYAGVQVGDPVTLLTPTGEATYIVAGIAADFLNAKVTTGYISQANLAADFGQEEDVFFMIETTPDAQPEAVESAFTSLLQDYPQFRLIAGKDYYEQNAGLLDAVFGGMYVLVIFLSAPSLIAMVNTLAIGVIERTREIGMLRAVGATRRQVQRMVVAEALILAGIGVALGLAAGLYMGYMATAAITTFGLPLEYIFPVHGVLAAISAGLVFGVLAAIIPARQASGLEIVTALRFE